MNAIAKKTTTQEGTCEGTIGTERYEAVLVEYLEADNPPPHGPSHFMRATQIDANLRFKELVFSFSKDRLDGQYSVDPDETAVELRFIDSTLQNNPVTYSKYEGIAILKFDVVSKVFSGTIVATLQTNDDVPILLDINVEFKCAPHVQAARNPRRPSPPKHCRASK